MRIIETKVFTYGELSDTAKQKARHWYTGDGFEFDAYGVIEDVKQIADIIGLDDCNVFYSGFCSQGDGACVNGRYSYSKGALKRIKEYAPTDAVLHGIAKRLQVAQRRACYKIECKITHSGGYCHYNSMDYEYGNDDVDFWQATEIENAFKDFAKWIYKQLESNFDYQTSDTAVAETIEVNGYEFTEEGKIL
jgi:hypothetical protein